MSDQTPIQLMTEREFSAMNLGVKTDKVALTLDECHKLIGIPQSVKINFVPQMMASLAMSEATELINYCIKERVENTKKHIRAMKTCVSEYAERLRDAYGREAFEAYVVYTEKYADKVSWDMFRMRIYADTLCKNQTREQRHCPICVSALIIVMLVKYCRVFDCKMDELISRKTGRIANHRNDVYLSALHDICTSLALQLGYKIDPDKTMGDFIAGLSVKAHLLADTIIEEETTPTPN